MWIIEKIKEYWLIILGVIIVIGLFTIYIDYILTALIMFLIIALIFTSLYAVNKSIKTGFMGFFILLALATYNPDLEKITTFLQENKTVSPKNISSNYQVIKKTDWVLFSTYEVKFIESIVITSDNTDIQKKMTTHKTYIGFLKNFWELPQSKNIIEGINIYLNRLPGIFMNNKENWFP